MGVAEPIQIYYGVSTEIGDQDHSDESEYGYQYFHCCEVISLLILATIRSNARRASVGIASHIASGNSATVMHPSILLYKSTDAQFKQTFI